jgi:hypothetical protein
MDKIKLKKIFLELLTEDESFRLEAAEILSSQISSNDSLVVKTETTTVTCNSEFEDGTHDSEVLSDAYLSTNHQTNEELLNIHIDLAKATLHDSFECLWNHIPSKVRTKKETCRKLFNSFFIKEIEKQTEDRAFIVDKTNALVKEIKEDLTINKSIKYSKSKGVFNLFKNLSSSFSIK